MKLELVSFELCPYVQRSVITLNHKKAPYKITYIDLENPPAWFEKISPLGKVPVLKVDDKTVLFESAVINEFVDETVGAPLHSKDPLQKAFERAWIEYGSELFMEQYQLFTKSTASEIEEVRQELFKDLLKLEDVVVGPFFRGKDFGLVDTSYAPLFMRLFLSDVIANQADWKKMPKVRAWGEALLKLPEVKSSVIPDFAEKFKAYCRENGSPLFGTSGGSDLRTA